MNHDAYLEMVSELPPELTDEEEFNRMQAEETLNDLIDQEPVFLEYCPSCGHKHRMRNQPCPACFGRGGWTPQPVSGKVADQCRADYSCDGCVAYRQHEAV